MFGPRPRWPLLGRLRMQPLLRSLLLRFMVVAVPLLGVFVVFNFFFVTEREHDALADELRKRAVSISRNLALNGAQARESFGDYLLLPLARAAAQLPDVSWVAFSDEKGRILAEAGTEAGLARRAGPLMAAVLGQREAVESLSEGTHSYVGVSQPMTSRAGPLGCVQLGLCTDRLQTASAAARRDAMVLTLLLLAAIVLVTMPLVYAIVKPVRSLLRAARDIANGNLSTRVALTRRDELGRLAVAMNRMAERLGELVEREQAKRQSLEMRVAELRVRSEEVADGRLDVRAPEGDDELGRLGAGFNEMVAHIQRLVEGERAAQKTLEANHAVLEAANSRLMSLDRKKSDFLNTVSHELRTPLTSIKAFSEILLEQEAHAEADREFLGIIDQEADRLTRLVEDLLDLTRIESEPVQNMTRLPLDVVIDGCLRSCRALAEQRGISMHSEGEGDLAVRGDRDRLAQVVTNLLSNAIKFTPPGGAVTVRRGRGEDGVTVSVRDTGLGIPTDDLGRIFEEFHQVDRGEGQGPAGSGLGLPIVRSIVEAHGGRISVESTPGKGSTFTVWLPSA